MSWSVIAAGVVTAAVIAGGRAVALRLRRRWQRTNRAILFGRFLRLDKRLRALATEADAWIAATSVPEAIRLHRLDCLSGYLIGIDHEVEFILGDLRAAKGKAPEPLLDDLTELISTFGQTISVYDRGIRTVYENLPASPLDLPDDAPGTGCLCLRPEDVERVDILRSECGVLIRSAAKRLKRERSRTDSTCRWPVYRWEAERIDVVEAWAGEPVPLW